MNVAITGTPGTGKTTVADHLDTELSVVHLNEVIQDQGFTQGTDDDRDSTIADLDAVQDWFSGRDDCIVESHLAHHLSVDVVVVLRCAPAELRRRLEKEGVTADSIEENVESERLDVVLVEAVEEHGMESVYEIDTTDESPAAVAEEIQAVIAGDREPNAGSVSYLHE